jgi:hypothetical protein
MTLDSRTAPDGAHIATDVRELIDGVVLSPRVPYATRRAVIEITESKGLQRQIVRGSTVDAIPYSAIQIVDG